MIQEIKFTMWCKLKENQHSEIADRRILMNGLREVQWYNRITGSCKGTINREGSC